MNHTVMTNKALHDKLTHCVIEKYLADDIPPQRIDCSPLRINCFSACFSVNAITQKGQKGVYVKIPKIILYQKENEKIMPLSEEDIKLAEDEYNSLVYLSSHWCNDNNINVRFVRALGFMKEYNAIFTEQLYAKHFFKMFRQFNLKKTFTTRNDAVHLIMSRLGTALSRFHQTTIKECEFDIGGVLKKIQNICLQLKSFGIEPEFIDKIIIRLKKFNKVKINTHYTNTLKGFDVRQVFVDEDGAILLLDPGKMKTDYKEIDLARFIVTCRILYWGSMFFFLRMSPDISYEESFLQAYYGNGKRLGKVLYVLTIKELLKHWRMAYTVLGLKQWPSLVKKILKKTYIDPFYKWQIANELITLERYINE